MARPNALTATEAAARLRISPATLYAYVSRGLVGATPDPEDPRRSLYSEADIQRLARTKARGRKPEQIAASALDWGQPTLTSRITLIEGDRLFYRGQDAAKLAERASLEDVARLLWECGGDDPFAAPRAAPTAIKLSANDFPTDRCLAYLAAIGLDSGMMWQRDPRHLWADAALILRAMATASLDAKPSTHELNASAFAARVVASTGASLAACVAGGLAALSGPLHGGTTSLIEILFEEAERVGDAARVVHDRLRRGDRLPGFGHQLYAEVDPRAKALLKLLPHDATRERLLAAMARIDGKPPNVDFALVSLRRAAGLPRGAAIALFAVGRTAGWIAHALEQHADGKLIRPRARYAGAAPTS
jgi:citrate synthase